MRKRDGSTAEDMGLLPMVVSSIPPRPYLDASGLQMIACIHNG